ncbi:MAG: uroporphyrinogen-III synthase [Alphaproteobacteria bacterium]|nr:uroporphyrinogen-III synthase [Alphaproteobacteria bacterium]
MPTDPRPSLLLTRTRDDSLRFAARFPDWPVVVAPILRIVPVAHDGARLEEAPGLVFTSAHAVGAAGPGRRRLAICVGGRTAEAACAAGFTVRQGNGFAQSLLPMIAEAQVPLIHPHGLHLAQRLPVPGMVVYAQEAQPLDDRARALLEAPGPVILPVFSPRSARLVAQEVTEARAPLWLVAISAAARAAWHRPAAREAIATTPSACSMAEAVRAIAAEEQS